MPNSTRNVFLLPGDYCVGDARYRMRTLLGSCVSITLWHPRLCIGAMSHFVLGGRAAEGAVNARYGEDALQLMVSHLHGMGVRATECQAKIFGGGAMFTSAGSGLQDVGRRNGEAARAMLNERKIPIVGESLFGSGHRKLLFNVKSGDVWLSHVPLDDPKLLATHARLQEQLLQTKSKIPT